MADNPQANSLANGNAYVAHSQHLNLIGGETLLFLRNTGAAPLVIDQITVGSDTTARFEMHIAKLYQDGFTGDTTESHFKAITILFDEMREAQSDGHKGIDQ